MTNDSGSKYSQASYQALFKFLRALKRQKRVDTLVCLQGNLQVPFGLPHSVSHQQRELGLYCSQLSHSLLLFVEHKLFVPITSWFKLLVFGPYFSSSFWAPKAAFCCAKECSVWSAIPASQVLNIGRWIVATEQKFIAKINWQGIFVWFREVVVSQRVPGRRHGPALCRQLVTRDEVQSWKGLGIVRRTLRGVHVILSQWRK